MRILKKFFLFIRFLAFYSKEVIISNLRVAHDVLTPRDYSQPAILALKLDATHEWEIFLVANLISMTPGTLSMDVSTDRRTLYIHAMFAENPEHLKNELKATLERRVLELTR
ncbi:MAG: Na+/H+ antiporter subunit E [Chthoniobacterales bacterium]|nr:Na+/H+ antiporter subunit E [Chthoniobacterales bacterium]